LVEVAGTGETDRRRRAARRAASRRRTVALAALAGLAALAAPAAFTGHAAIDALERALLAGGFTFVVAHGRRATLLVGTAVVAALSRDVSLWLLLASMAASLANLTRPRRVKELGALAAGAAVNAALWAPAAHRPAAVHLLTALAGAVVLVAAGRQLRSTDRRVLVRASVALALVLAAGVAFAAVAAARSAPAMATGADRARQALTAVRDGDSERAARLLDQAGADLDRARGALGGWAAPARLVPALAQQVHAVEVAVAEAHAVTDAADDLLATDYDSLRYEGRLDVERVAALGPGAERVTEVLTTADHRLAEVADGPLLGTLRRRLDEFRDSIERARRDAARAALVLRELPELAGARGERHYLVVFTAPAELRGGGGFIGSYAELTVVDGRLELSRSGRIGELVSYAPDSGRTLDAPADYVRRYGRFHVEDHVQDATLSPDWPATAQALAGIYPQAGGRAVDGVLAVDPTGLAALLELTGPVAVEGLDRPLDASNAATFLSRDQYLEHGDRAAREEVLAAATRATFEALTDASLPAPRTLGDVLGPAARGRHLRVWLRRPAEQAVLAELGADAPLAVPAGADGFTLVQQNVGNNKIDAYLRRDLVYEATLDPATATVTGDLTVTLRNEVPALDLPDAVVGNERGAPRGTNLATLALHTRLQVASATVDGTPALLGHDTEAGAPVWDTSLLAVPPGGDLTLRAEVQADLDLRAGYRIRLVPQGTVAPDAIRVSVRLAHGRFGSWQSDHGGARVEADGDRLTITGTLDEVLDVTVPIRR